MQRTVLVAFAIALAVFGGGCSMVAPQYSASMENVQTLKNAGGVSGRVGTFTSVPGPGNPDTIGLRASSMVSPYGGSYANYLAEAIKQELGMAGKLGAGTDIEVSGILLKNDMNIGSFTTGYGDIEARFVVKKGDRVSYDQVKTAHTEWESSFVGAVAIPRGQQEYPRLVQTLLRELYADAAFLQALR